MKNLHLFILVLALSTAPNAMAQGLPPTIMDSFVYEAGPSADLIYGDEGGDDIPPFQNFTADHRIAAGFYGATQAALTTGHGDYLPDAWGGDEFTGPEFSMSGPVGCGCGGYGGLVITIGSGCGPSVTVSGCASAGCGVSVTVSASGCGGF